MKKGYIVGATVGILMIAIGLTADMIGLGPNPGTGWKQMSLMAAGVLVFGVSLYLGKTQD